MKKQFTIFSAMIIFTLIVASFFLSNETKAATTCGESYTQGGLTYGTVLGSDSKCWLDRNLGATQVATAYNDSASYGWIFQWGRGVDGHQLPTSDKTSTASNTDVPGHAYFIRSFDWRDPQNDNLWQGANGINNPCPTDFRLPTIEEWTTLISSAGITNITTAFDSSLKLTAGGYRGPASGTYEGQSNVGYYWSSSVAGTSAYDIKIDSSNAGPHNYQRAVGFSVRCIADFVTDVPPCTSWTYSNWGTCSLGGLQTRTITSSSPNGCMGGNPILSQSCAYVPPVCTSWAYSDWSTCLSSGLQTRNIISSSPNSCTGGSPVLSQSCNYIPICTVNDWSCNSWSNCSTNGIQTRICSKTSNCQGGVTSPVTSQSCTYIPTTPACISLYYSNWSECTSEGKQTRSLISKYPTNCESGELPKLTQSCTYIPACSADIWECGSWGTCSPQGVQTRSCSRTYDCPSAETAAPATSQYCVAPNQPQQQTPTENLGIVNQSSIIKSTAKLICPINSTMASQGSGTVIDSKGTILTNKHVIDGTAGCWVGFIDDYDDEPYFGDRQIADIYKISSDTDIAVLKLRNPSNKTLTSINISQSNSGSIKLGETLTTYGYPAKFGTKITYTSGDFSGVDGNYLKTTAIIEHGNSGGGAYLKNGTFIGIPTAVIKGSLNSMGYLLSVNKVNSWLNNSIAYNYNKNNNNYSRVSAMLEDMDLSALGSLGLFIAGDETNIKTATESQTVIAEEKKLTTKIDNNLSKRMNGNILLQVEKNGEGWYVYPDDKKKYYLGRPADAFSIMRNLGLGIKHNELTKYLNSKFSSKLSGKILLDVEQNGEAYYVNPKNLKGYFLNRPADAFKVMRDLGLGITNADIRKIGVGEIK